MIDRPTWIAANLLTMRPLLDPLLERLGGGADADGEDSEADRTGETSGEKPEAGDVPANAPPNASTGPSALAGLLSGPLRSASGSLRSASGHLLGAQLGAVTGMLSQRVLGQYDVSLLDASAPPRLLLLAPNLAAAARNLGVDRDELIAWVAIHEITHAVQFSGAPWLREHLGGHAPRAARRAADLGDAGGSAADESDGKNGHSDWLRDPGALLDRAR